MKKVLYFILVISLLTTTVSADVTFSEKAVEVLGVATEYYSSDLFREPTDFAATVPMKSIPEIKAKSKREMIRVIKTPENEVVLDSTGKKNGRGAYVCPNLECLKKARKSKGIERAFKMAIPNDVYEKLEKEMSLLD